MLDYILKILLLLGKMLLILLVIFSPIIIFGVRFIYKISIPDKMWKPCLRARNDIYKQIIIPLLKNQNFVKEPFNFMNYGWIGCRYLYGWARIQNNKVEILSFIIDRGDTDIHTFVRIYNVYPTIQNFSDLSDDWYRKVSRIDATIGTFEGFKSCKLKDIHSQKKLERSKLRLEKKIKKQFSNIDTTLSLWNKYHDTRIFDRQGNQIGFIKCKHNNTFIKIHYNYLQKSKH